MNLTCNPLFFMVGPGGFEPPQKTFKNNMLQCFYALYFVQ
jgi:hypothetical protein